ncbi:MAG TPA: hypothetical protein VG408_05600, partial [Actinomycetota bacterium]|nr:hypothetical protein [Actinomycetota bacterium]
LVACGGSDTTNPATFGDDRDKTRAPANDSFSAAEVISRVPFNKTASTTGATLESNEPRPCAEIDNTVWYRYTPQRDINVRARASATFGTAVAVYSGTDMTALTEVGCAAAGPETELQFGALAGETYNIQVGSADGSEGNIGFGLTNANQAQLLLGDPGPLLPGWTEKVLVEEIPVSTPAVGPVDARLIVIDGAPQPAKPKMYDINITAAGTPLPTITLNSQGFLTEPIHVELVQIAKESTTAAVKLFYRFDPDVTTCQLGVGGNCVVSLPLDPTDVWWTTENGPAAELIILAKIDVGKVDINGTAANVDVPNPLYVRIPLLGQVRAILP